MTDAQSPVPPLPERPRYGEYAPGFGPGSTPPVAVPASGAPVAPPAPAAIPAAPAFPVAPGTNAYPVQPNLAPYPGNYPGAPKPQRTRKTWDVVLTILLLVVGFFVALFTIAATGSPDVLKEGLDGAIAQRGGTSFSNAGAVPGVSAFIWISHAVLWVIALGFSIPLLVRRRIAFWLPLTAGIIAAVIFWGGLFALLLSDPALVKLLSSQS